jgi:hypothetical protein
MSMLQIVCVGFQGFVLVNCNFLLLVLVQSALDGAEGGMQPHNRT